MLGSQRRKRAERERGPHWDIIHSWSKDPEERGLSNQLGKTKPEWGQLEEELSPAPTTQSARTKWPPGQSSVTMHWKPKGAVLLVSWEGCLLCIFLCYQLGEASTICQTLQANPVARPLKQGAFVHD